MIKDPTNNNDALPPSDDPALPLPDDLAPNSLGVPLEATGASDPVDIHAYQSAAADTSPPLVAQLLSPSALRPRIWPTVVVSLLAIPTAFVVAVIALVIALVIAHNPDIARNPQSLQNGQVMQQWFQTLLTSPMGLFVLILPGQLTFLTIAAGAALLSPQPLASRLAMVKSACPIWTWFIFALATPCIGYGTSYVMSFYIDQPSQHMQMLDELFRKQVQSSVFVVLLLVSVMPGISEELLFRGYVQNRLLRRWPTFLAIGYSAVVFAMAHMDPMHVVAVFPLGIWLGVVAWRTGSVWPSILCHMANNAVGVLDLYLHPDESQSSELSGPWLGLLSLCVVALVISVILFVRYKPPSTLDTSASELPQPKTQVAEQLPSGSEPPLE